LVGNTRSNVPLPSRDGLPPGAGWDISSVLDVERYIVLEVAGGGSYEISVTDAKAESMTWVTFWDPRQYPSKIPTTLADSMPQPMPQQPQQPQQVMAPFAPMQPGWPPSAAQMYAPAPQPTQIVPGSVPPSAPM